MIPNSLHISISQVIMLANASHRRRTVRYIVSRTDSEGKFDRFRHLSPVGDSALHVTAVPYHTYKQIVGDFGAVEFARRTKL